jgi:hypothetical protein
MGTLQEDHWEERGRKHGGHGKGVNVREVDYIFMKIA